MIHIPPTFYKGEVVKITSRCPILDAKDKEIGYRYSIKSLITGVTDSGLILGMQIKSYTKAKEILYGK